MFAACVVPRAVAAPLLPPPPPNFHWRIADSILQTGTFALDGVPTGAYEPLYPLWLAATRWLTGDTFTGAMAVQVLLASLGGVLLFRFAERTLSSRTAALVAAGCYAFYPYYVRQSTVPVALSLSVVLLIAIADRFAGMRRDRDAVVLGALAGLLILVRTTFLPVWIAVLAILIWRAAGRRAAIVAATTAVVLLPWALLSAAQGRALVPSRAGENLYVSTCDPARDIVPLHDVDLLVGPAFAKIDADRLSEGLEGYDAEEVIDAALLHAAVACARERPLQTLGLKLRNLAYTFSPQLLPADARTPRPTVEIREGRAQVTGTRPRPLREAVPHFVAHAAITVAAIAGLWRRRRQLGSDLVLLAMLANTVIVYTVFFPTTRLTAPTAFVLMFYGGAAFQAMRRSTVSESTASATV